MAAFFEEFAALEPSVRHEIADSLLAPILNAHDARPSNYYSIWMLSVFSRDGSWDHAESLVRIFRETSSDAIRRYAALALAASGTRAQAVAIKEYLRGGSSLCRTAMLLATAKLGKDERKHLKNSLRLGDSLEKLCMTEQI